MAKKKKLQLDLPCEVCGKAVKISDKARFLRLVRTGGTVRCGQCRRYVSPGDARVPQAGLEPEVPGLALRRKRSSRSTEAAPIASLPLGCCGHTRSDVGGAVDE